MRLHLLLRVINVACIPINHGDSNIGINQRHVVPRDQESELRSHDRTDQKTSTARLSFAPIARILLSSMQMSLHEFLSGRSTMSLFGRFRGASIFSPLFIIAHLPAVQMDTSRYDVAGSIPAGESSVYVCHRHPFIQRPRKRPPPRRIV